MLQVTLLHFWDAIIKHTSTRLKVEERWRHRLVPVSVPQCSQFSHYNIEVISFLTHHVQHCLGGFEASIPRYDVSKMVTIISRHPAD
jgi:hypothetical protein